MWLRSDIATGGRYDRVAVLLLLGIVIYPYEDIPLKFYDVASAGVQNIDGVPTSRFRITADWSRIVGWLEDEDLLAEVSARTIGAGPENFSAAFREITSQQTRPLQIWVDQGGLLRQFTAGFIEGFAHEDTVRYSGYDEPLVILPPREFEVDGEDGGNVLLPEPTPTLVATPTPSPVPTATLLPLPTLTPTLSPTPTPRPTPTPMPTPSISLSPAQVSFGAHVDVTGAGFDPGVVVTVSYGAIDGGVARDDESGAFVVDIVVPPLSVNLNNNRISAQSDNGGFAWFDHVVATPKVQLSTSQAKIGTFIDASGTGFAPEVPAELVFGETLLAGPPLPYTDIHGEIDFRFRLPDSESGPGEFQLTVAGDRATAGFEVLPPTLTVTRDTTKPNSIFTKGSGFFLESSVTFSGAGSVFKNAKSTDKNGDFEYEMVYTRDVRSEQITVTVEGVRASVSRVILAFNTKS